MNVLKTVTLFVFLVSSSLSSQNNNDTCRTTVPKVLDSHKQPDLTFNCSCKIIQFEFKLYSRWGVVVYSTEKWTDPLGFNAFEKVKKNENNEFKHQDGIYVWIAKYTIVLGNSKIEKELTGSLTIIR